MNNEKTKSGIMVILKKMLPPDGWKASVAIALGLFFGLAATAFKISNAVSYLSNDPKTCINCHLMYPQYSTWSHSSHRERATCADCHVPHDNVFRKYLVKGQDGSRHATIFTLRTEPQVIQIHEQGKGVVQENCIRCHVDQLNSVSAMSVTAKNKQDGKGHLCWDCHREVPHGRVKNQASTPHSIVPGLEPASPNWLMRLFGY